MKPGLTQLWTIPVGGGPPDSLTHWGHVAPSVYGYTLPGGCDQLTSVFQRGARLRPDVIDPGRTLLGVRGGSVVWGGILDEPVPTGDGWQISAHGAGGDGARYNAIWTGTWGTGVFDNAVNAAIGRGLPWVNPGIGAPSGIWAGQQVDTASIMISDLLNLGCTKGGLTWQVAAGPGGRNVLSVLPLPTHPNRILVATDAVAQTINDGPTVIYIRYQITADAGNKAATYGLTSVSDGPRTGKLGRSEAYVDLSSGGIQTAGQAQAVGLNVLKKFTRASFSDSFTFKYGDLLNMGGVPVDPGVFYCENGAPMVTKLMLADYTASGEVNPGTLNLLIGAYQWDDGACTGTMTAFESLRSDFAGLMQAAVNTMPVRTLPVAKKKKGK